MNQSEFSDAATSHRERISRQKKKRKKTDLLQMTFLLIIIYRYLTLLLHFYIFMRVFIKYTLWLIYSDNNKEID